MTADYFIELCRCGETSTVQFKREFTSAKKMAEEMSAMANSRGGVMLFGVEIKLGNSYIRNKNLVKLGNKTMPYRGLGSGIPRIMSEKSHVDFINDIEGNQFTAIVWCTTQKDFSTTQKNDLITQKKISTTQKNDLITQKEISTTQKNDSTTQKEISTTQKEISTTQKNDIVAQKELSNVQKGIIKYLRNHAMATRTEIATELGNITEDGIKYNLSHLQKIGAIKRVGGRKLGHWETIWKI